MCSCSSAQETVTGGRTGCLSRDAPRRSIATRVPSWEMAGQHMDAVRLRRALSVVPGANREVVVLRDLEGLDASTVAEMLDVSVGAVKSRLHRGRLQLAAAVRVEFGQERGEEVGHG